ncbi:MAG: TonB-dependent receptor domain-containing protein [Marinilabiliaceae bacterium]
MMRILIIAQLMLFISTAMLAQKGTIRGTVHDGETGETLVGVSVVVKGTTKGAATDLDGEFSLNLDPGTYDLDLSFISYQDLTIEDVEVKENDVTALNDIQLQESSMELKDVVVSASAIRNTEAALQTMKRKSSVMLDGISAAKIEMTGDGNAVEAAKRVTGVTIEEGKYVYVRGLGDRYSKTSLNSMEIPGLDPDRNSLQMDIFPTNIIDNMMVNKTFTANLPADFTGGLMNVSTKAFPDEKTMNISVETSINPQVNFNPNFLTYKGGETDFLGFDDGTRALPDHIPEDQDLLATPANGENIKQFVNKFSPVLNAQEDPVFADYSLGFSVGNQKKIGSDNGNNPRLGYIFSLSYKAESDFDDKVFYGDYKNVSNPQNNEMIYSTRQKGAVGEKKVLTGVLGGLAYKNNYNKIRLTALRLQNGNSSAGQFTIDNNGLAAGQSGYFATSDQLQYNQRSLTNFLLHGTHVFEEKEWELDWRVSPTFSTADDPDIRKTAFTHESDGDIVFNSGAAGYPSRIWRELSELNNSSKVDLTKEYELLEKAASLQFGASHSYKERDYEIVKMGYQLSKLSVEFPEPDASLVLEPDNIYDGQNGFLYMIPESSPSNAYESNVHNTAVYLSNEFYPFPKLKSTIGLRMENYVMHHTGQDQNGKRKLDNEKVLNSTDIFPGVNFIYEISDSQNLRASYSRTIARPSFKELSFAQIIDPLSNTIFNGGLYAVDEWDGNLKETNINNLDLRWEHFWEKGQNISASLFYKDFQDPIELVRLTSSVTSTEYQPRNVGEGTLFGAEFEFNRNLDFISPVLKNLSMNGNLTYTQSEIEMTDSEFRSRKAFEKEGQTIDRTRDMAGQSPYVVNAGLSYSDVEKGLSTGLFYNVKGSTLSIVGAGVFPDMYDEPFHSMNFSLNKKLGEEQRTQLDFKVSNILNETQKSFYKSYKAKDQPNNIYHPGRTFSIGMNYKF